MLPVGLPLLLRFLFVIVNDVNLLFEHRESCSVALLLHGCTLLDLWWERLLLAWLTALFFEVLSESLLPVARFSTKLLLLLILFELLLRPFTEKVIVSDLFDQVFQIVACLVVLR